MKTFKREDYLERVGIRCPYCSAVDPVGGSMYFDRGIIEQRMGCVECDAVWYDHYKLVDVFPSEDRGES